MVTEERINRQKKKKTDELLISSYQITSFPKEGN